MRFGGGGVCLVYGQNVCEWGGTGFVSYDGDGVVLGCGVCPAVLHPRRVVPFIRRVRGCWVIQLICVSPFRRLGFLVLSFLLLLWGFPIALVILFICFFLYR